MVIKEAKVKLSITKCCLGLGVNRSSYYKWLKRSNVLSVRCQGECACRLLVHYAYHKRKGTYGKMRIKLYLERIKVKMNHKKIHRLMKNLGLKAVIRKKWCQRKYKKHHIYENKLNRNFTSLEPQIKYVTDVTQLNQIKGQKYYFSPVIDLYNNEIICYSVSKNNDTDLVKTMLEGLSQIENKFLIHSDQGSQYTSKMYLPTLKKIHPEVEISMSRVGCCNDNAYAKSFLSHFKSEFYVFFNPQTEEELHHNIEEFIDYYNHDRIQIKLKTSPVKYRTSLAAQLYSFYDCLLDGGMSTFDIVFCMAVLQRTPHQVTNQGITNLKKIYPFERFEKQIIELDKYLKPGGLMVVHFSQYYFADTSIASNYEVFGDYNQNDYRSSIFDKDSKLIKERPVRHSIFQKKR